MKTCPFCAEEIQDAAIVCRYCGRDLEQDEYDGSPKYYYASVGKTVQLTIYRARLSIEDRRGGMSTLVFPKKTDIMIRNITGVNIKGFMRNLELTLSDGTKREIPLLYGKDAEKAREVLLSLM